MELTLLWGGVGGGELCKSEGTLQTIWRTSDRCGARKGTSKGTGKAELAIEPKWLRTNQILLHELQRILDHVLNEIPFHRSYPESAIIIIGLKRVE